MAVWINGDFRIIWFFFFRNDLSLRIWGYGVVLHGNKGKAKLILTAFPSFPAAVGNTNIVLLYMHSYNLKL